jgi:hypothetical protein
MPPALHTPPSLPPFLLPSLRLKDIDRLQSLLMSLLVTKQIVGNLTELATPVVMRWMAEAKAGRGAGGRKGGREGGRKGKAFSAHASSPHALLPIFPALFSPT